MSNTESMGVTGSKDTIHAYPIRKGVSKVGVSSEKGFERAKTKGFARDEYEVHAVQRSIMPIRIASSRFRSAMPIMSRLGAEVGGTPGPRSRTRREGGQRRG